VPQNNFYNSIFKPMLGLEVIKVQVKKALHKFFLFNKN